MTIIPIQVTDEAVIIPKIYLHGAHEVEVEVTDEYVIVRPKSQPTELKDKPIHIYTPKIADPKQVLDFKMEVVKES
jgi:putative ubiquitin-RnfH superfamily antitoxin RatB of RatAB toxin-antitoxin module